MGLYMVRDRASHEALRQIGFETGSTSLSMLHKTRVLCAMYCVVGCDFVPWTQLGQ